MLDKLEKVVGLIEEYICVGLILIMCVSVFAQVLFRYVFAVPLSWTEEISRYSLIWLTFIAGAMCIRTNSHYVIDVLVNKLPVPPRLAMNILILTSMGAFAGVMFFTGLEILPIVDYQISPALRISMGYIYLAIPFGSLLMLFHLFCAIRLRLRWLKNPAANPEALLKNAH
ncbi:MAG: TRAP transporter small permease [Sporomusaceae bacterium]|nr:TRAP transporter small permease [Sporomusaceae bacterium]